VGRGAKEGTSTLGEGSDEKYLQRSGRALGEGDNNKQGGDSSCSMLMRGEVQRIEIPEEQRR